MQYFYLLILPTIGLLLNFIFKPKSKIDALLGALGLIGFNIYIFLTGNWINLASVFLSLIPSALYNLIIVIQLIVRMIRIKEWWYFYWPILLKITISILTLIPVIKYHLIEYPPGIQLEYPLKNGSYYVIQGGILSSMNYHHEVMKDRPNDEVRYAVDIVKLNVGGRNINMSIQNEVLRHEIYSDTLYSPTNGIVIHAQDDEEDYDVERPILIGEQDGNYLVIKHNKILIVHGHLKMNSITVEAGDSVEVGQPIALIGHSGQSNLPHLHIHAYAEQQTFLEEGDSTNYVYPIPMYFGKDWEFLEKNGYVDP